MAKLIQQLFLVTMYFQERSRVELLKIVVQGLANQITSLQSFAPQIRGCHASTAGKKNNREHILRIISLEKTAKSSKGKVKSAFEPSGPLGRSLSRFP